MFVVRLLALLLLTVFCYGMGTIENGNAIAKVFGPLFFVAAPALYFLPMIEAALRKHGNLPALGALNLLLGWTLIGWVGALVWALAKPHRAADQEPAAPERTCPFCAETVRAAAIVCKHCGRDLAPIK